MSEFSLFSLAHFLTLSLIATVLIGSLCAYKKGSDQQKKYIVRGLAICCLLSKPVHWILVYSSGSPFSTESVFPFHLCDLAAIICGLALLSESTKLGELAYFWGLAATLQGLITPDISANFPHPLFISFFWSHGFIVVAALFLPLALHLRPTKAAIWRTFGITQIYAICAVTLNSQLGTNYGFLASKPQSASLLDFLPEWPWYILVLEILCLTLLWLLQLPFSQKSVK